MVKVLQNRLLHSRNEVVNGPGIHYEAAIYKEMLNAIENKDNQQLDWFSSFGDSFRTIAMNVHAYRKGLEFGITEIAFDKYGWFVRPEWEDKEELIFGDTSRYGNYSTITLGRGINGLWTYAMSYSYGVGGGGYGLSVYDKQFKSRDDAFHTALAVLKAKMTAKIGSADTLNDKQPIILGTLKAIEKAEIARIEVQYSAIENKIIKLKSFKKVSPLTPYLERVSIDERGISFNK